MPSFSTFITAVSALALSAAPALAHTGIGATAGVSDGFAHPLGGLDHALAMIAVGLLAAQVGGRALWIVPLAFVGVMTIGAAASLAGLSLPHVELGIGLSLVAFGLAAAFGAGLPTAAVAALVGGFALFHGHAHGAEMPDTASGLAYGAGFVAATALLHGVGIALGLAAARITAAPALRLAGGAVAVAGVVLLLRA